jgi:hypothetical protein
MTKGHNEKEWTVLGYPEGMGSAKFRLSPPNRDFIRAYYLTSAEHGISSISLGRLKVTRFSEVNDPFELMALNVHRSEIRKLMTHNKDSQNIKTGLLCFSKNWTNPILWSHYADKHKGICLGFDLRRGSEVQEVDYEKERLRMEPGTHGGPPSISPGLQDRLLRTKFEGWQYEQEIRRFVDLSKARQEKGLYFLPLDEDLRLKEVILGVRNDFSLDDIRKLTKAVNPIAVVFKTRLERRGFRIVGDGRYPPEIPTEL